ncbi:la-related protein 6A isoform X2 [Amborella trichopoda]|uniref:HTH La-type RNA-binding domain-containing protein n=1 Tax=Amborella trichopoda TaxID=13333 RepID=W1PIR5_AMBTC|nr:la-related protein 6A isoform X2 [Amborella trichopoda]ERN07000.1 hypothetical protein AMTR_s00141p00064150 [Amborella trichopoda]|eukprot:XP_006845325.1 la-related protein 6A isoform X2 [Amborella trichopoda]
MAEILHPRAQTPQTRVDEYQETLSLQNGSKEMEGEEALGKGACPVVSGHENLEILGTHLVVGAMEESLGVEDDIHDMENRETLGLPTDEELKFDDEGHDDGEVNPEIVRSLSVVEIMGENLGFDEDAGHSDTAGTPPTYSSKPVLTDELRDKIIKQVEYYFSNENLHTDKFLMKYMKKDKEGFVPISLIASFRKMKKLVQDKSLVVAALGASSQLVVSANGKKVKRLHPLPATDATTAKSRTVLVENLPEDHSAQNIERIFGDVGKVNSVRITEPQSSTHAFAKSNKPEMMISSKLHALVEYETVEAAEKAVAVLNDERNWRSGMRVQLLLKRMGMYGAAPRSRKGLVAESSNSASNSDIGDEANYKTHELHTEKSDMEVERHSPSEREGLRGRRRGRGKGHGQHHNDGHGAGLVCGISGSEAPMKQPPGPRMPDGTRGFTMGRGRPPPQ